MTLREISRDYEAAALLIQRRLQFLRKELESARDSEEIWQLQRRIAELTPILTEMNELRELPAHYDERG